MDELTQAFFDALDTGEDESQVGDMIVRLAEKSSTLEIFASKLEIALGEVLPNASTRLRSLFNASGEVPLIYSKLLRAALREVNWLELVKELNAEWGLNIRGEN